MFGHWHWQLAAIISSYISVYAKQFNGWLLEVRMLFLVISSRLISCQVTFIFRIYCIYNRSKPVTALLIASVLTELVVKMVNWIWDLSDKRLHYLQHSSLAYGEPVLLPKGLSGCVQSVSPEKLTVTLHSIKFLANIIHSGNKYVATWIMECVTGASLRVLCRRITYKLLDGLVVALTLYRTYQAYWKTKVFRNHPIWTVIMKDGKPV